MPPEPLSALLERVTADTQSNLHLLALAAGRAASGAVAEEQVRAALGKASTSLACAAKALMAALQLGQPPATRHAGGRARIRRPVTTAEEMEAEYAAGRALQAHMTPGERLAHLRQHFPLHEGAAAADERHADDASSAVAAIAAAIAQLRVTGEAEAAAAAGEAAVDGEAAAAAPAEQPAVRADTGGAAGAGDVAMDEA